MKILPGIRWNNTPINWKLEGEENNEQFIIEPVGQVTLGVGDASLRMHRLHDVLQFFETSLKNRIVKN